MELIDNRNAFLKYYFCYFVLNLENRALFCHPLMATKQLQDISTPSFNPRLFISEVKRNFSTMSFSTWGWTLWIHWGLPLIEQKCHERLIRLVKMCCSICIKEFITIRYEMLWVSPVRVCCWLFEAWISSECGNTVNRRIYRKPLGGGIPTMLWCDTPNSWHATNPRHFKLLALGLKSLGSESSWLMLGVESLGSKIP